MNESVTGEETLTGNEVLEKILDLYPQMRNTPEDFPKIPEVAAELGIDYDDFRIPSKEKEKRLRKEGNWDPSLFCGYIVPVDVATAIVENAVKEIEGRIGEEPEIEPAPPHAPPEGKPGEWPPGSPERQAPAPAPEAPIEESPNRETMLVTADGVGILGAAAMNAILAGSVTEGTDPPAEEKEKLPDF